MKTWGSVQFFCCRGSGSPTPSGCARAYRDCRYTVVKHNLCAPLWFISQHWLQYWKKVKYHSNNDQKRAYYISLFRGTFFFVMLKKKDAIKANFRIVCKAIAIENNYITVLYYCITFVICFNKEISSSSSYHHTHRTSQKALFNASRLQLPSLPSGKMFCY